MTENRLIDTRRRGEVGALSGACDPIVSRRNFLTISSLAAAYFSLPVFSSDRSAPDYKLEIAPVTLDLSPRHRLKTVAYNGQPPGPLLRLKENRPVTIEVANRTDRPEIVHW